MTSLHFLNKSSSKFNTNAHLALATRARSVHPPSHCIMMMMMVRTATAVQGHSGAIQHLEVDGRSDLHGSTLKAHAASVREDGTSEFNAPAVCAIARPRGVVRHHPLCLSVSQ